MSVFTPDAVVDCSPAMREMIERQGRAWMENDFALAAPDWSPDVVLTAPGNIVLCAEIEEAMASFHADFTDLRITLTHASAAPGGTLACLAWLWATTRRADGAASVTADAIVVEPRGGLTTAWREYFDTAGSVETHHRDAASQGAGPRGGGRPPHGSRGAVDHPRRAQCTVRRRRTDRGAVRRISGGTGRAGALCWCRMFIVTRDTVQNPSVLAVKQLPRRFVERVTVWPRVLSFGMLLRIVAEFRPVRYGLWLVPLVIVALVWNEVALPLGSAPVLMVVLIWLAESRLLRVPPKRRAALVDPDDAARGLDLLGVQGRAALTRIAAGRGLRSGVLRLVVEQSPLSWLPPLTYVTVQSEVGPAVLDLTRPEREVIETELFRDPLTERRLHMINAAEDRFLREVTLEARGVSAHARLEAALA